MVQVDVSQARRVLDALIIKQRVHMYKPIQVAEILYHTRQGELTIEQVENDLEAYRNPSKRWRNSVTRLLLDQVSTSSEVSGQSLRLQCYATQYIGSVGSSEYWWGR